jgi:hypothetical protein
MMKIEWVDDLPPEPKQNPLPSVVQVNVPSKQPNWLIIIALAVLAYLYFQSRQPEPAPQPDDQTVIVDDDKQSPQPAPTPVDLKGATLVFVLENLSPTVEQLEVMLSVTNEGLQKKHGMAGFVRYDEEQPEVQALIDFAVSKNTPSPFVALMRNKECIRLASFPRTPAELEAFLR